LHCTPRKPLCDDCPFSRVCVARSQNRVHLLPVKEKKVKVKARHLHYIVPVVGKSIGMKERTGRDIWNGLYDFPLIEWKQPMDEKRLAAHPSLLPINKKAQLVNAGSRVHLLTHQRLNIHFFLLKIRKENLTNFKASFQSIRLYTPKQAGTLPKPIVVTRFLEENKLIRTNRKEKV